MPMSSDSSSRSNSSQTVSPSVADTSGAGARGAASSTQNQYSIIGKSINVKGEITSSDPVYIYGNVEGSINAPSHRVTVGKEGTVKADINAREVVIMGAVLGNVDADYRVEIRGEGSLTGDLGTHRLFIEDGAVLKGAVDVSKPSEEPKIDAQEEHAVIELGEATSAA